MTPRLLCIGLGYTAEALARRVAPLGCHIAGTARSAEGAARIASLGYDSIPFDGSAPSPALADAIAAATHIVISASPDEAGDPALRFHADDLARAPSLSWIGYLSTIGVYGNADGGWVDETTPPNPGSPRTRRRVAAEAAWLGFGKEHGKTVQVFRLGGIYGPGRSAIDDLRDGTARRIVKPGQVFNRIHVDDIAAVLEAAASGRGSHSLYDVTDGNPSPPQDVVAFAAELLGVPPPPELPFEQAGLSPMGLSFYSENRRVRSRRIVDDLGVRLAYPTYREGLAAIASSSSTGTRR
jgi:nucleoside-diphosphate-sugar epimerase